jgi:hypothetical protein
MTQNRMIVAHPIPFHPMNSSAQTEKTFLILPQLICTASRASDWAERFDWERCSQVFCFLVRVRFCFGVGGDRKGEREVVMLMLHLGEDRDLGEVAV